jgi:hypothetical protein
MVIFKTPFMKTAITRHSTSRKHFPAMRAKTLLISAITGVAFPMEAAPKAPYFPPLNTATLLEEATDLPSMTRYPAPFCATKQFSSYDRASVAPDKPGWFANDDNGHYVRKEERQGRTEHVLQS